MSRQQNVSTTSSDRETEPILGKHTSSYNLQTLAQQQQQNPVSLSQASINTNPSVNVPTQPISPNQRPNQNLYSFFTSYINFRWVIRKRNFLAQLSIWIIASMVLLLALTVFNGKIIGIIYLLFFLVFVLLFQTSYATWATFIKTYCILLIFYSFVTSLITYTYQFTAIKNFLESFISEKLIADIGLQNSDAVRMFYESTLPLVLTIFVVGYLRIFQEDFARLVYLAAETDTSVSAPLNNPTAQQSQHSNNQTFGDATVISLTTNSITGLSSQESRIAEQTFVEPCKDALTSVKLTSAPPTVSKRNSQSKNIVSVSHSIQETVEVFWRFLEVHCIKLVAFMIFRLAIIDQCLINFPLILLVIIMLRRPKTAGFSCLTASWLISAIIVARETFDIPSLSTFNIKNTCPNDSILPETLRGNEFSLLEYLGFSESSNSVHNKTFDHLIVLLLITARVFVTLHYEARAKKDYELSFGIIFPNIGRREADASILKTIMYFINFGFYEFGVEITCMSLVVVCAHRLDIFGAIYGLCLILLSVMISKRTLSMIWPLFTFLIILLIPIEYAMRLGVPKSLCFSYPWQSLQPDIKYFLYLPTYYPDSQSTKPQTDTTGISQDISLLLFDFIVLLAACRQTIVFKHINTIQSPITDNNLMHHNLSANDFRHKYLPTQEEFVTEDCFGNLTTQNTYLKSIFFISIYWITLATVLIAGATNVSLFSLGYLIGCFIFLWLGNDSYLQKPRTLLLKWNFLILYANIVILSKVVLQLFACFLPEANTSPYEGICLIFRLLRIVCKRRMDETNERCNGEMKSDEYYFLWDGLCLMFLLMQRVVFGTQYFRYLVQEVKAQQILASRGAELIRETQIEEAKAQDLYDKEVMRSIRKKMENLKSDNEETAKAWRALLELPHHHQIIRNAGKHLFSSLDDKPVSSVKQDNWKFRKEFIPDPLGDELERIADINGASAVFTRWMKGQPLYGSTATSSPSSSPFGTLTASGDTAAPSRTPPRVIQVPLTVQPSTSSAAEQQLERDDQRASFNQSIDTVASLDLVYETDTTSSCGSKFKSFCEFINLLIYSCLLSVTVQLNKFSRSFRYVSRRMTVEKNTLKQHFNLNDPRFKSDPHWKKWVINNISETYAKSYAKNQIAPSNTSLHRIRSALKVIASHQTSLEQGGSSLPSSIQQDSGLSIRQHSPGRTTKAEESDPEYSFLKLNMFTQFCRALGYVFVSNTSLLCQLVIILNQLFTASIFSLPLPLLTFLWGTLSVPRPTKRFWKTIITYTELAIVIKYIFQFPIGNWDEKNASPFYYANLLGIQRRSVTIIYDLLLLLALFLHRSMLKSLGQWDATVDEGSYAQLPQEDYNLKQYNTVQLKDNSGSFNSSASIPRYSASLKPVPVDRSVETEEPVLSKTIDASAVQAVQAAEVSYQNQECIHEQPNDKSSPMYGCCAQTGNCCKSIHYRIIKSIGIFFQHVLFTPYKVQTDVYTWMFCLDFINFLILIYGFWAFDGGYTNQSVTSFLDENRIPSSVLYMLLLQFASIIIDRAFYLQKNIASKLTFHVVLVIGIHFWIFFFLPATTNRAFILDVSWPPKAWYIIKCIYFLFSAHQIRSGYPRRVLGNCLTNYFGYANWYAFKIYRAIPLVYDLRLYMDWIWTETTLEFRNWSLLEDMFANLFIRKCELTIEEEYPYERAKPIRRVSKYLTGGAFILLILAIVWGPLLLFSMGKTVGQSNPPTEMEYELEFVGYQPILRIRATAPSINPLNQSEFDDLKKAYPEPPSQTFFGDYKVNDIARVRFNGQSNAVWEISPPSKKLLMRTVNSNDTTQLTLKSSWTIFRVKKQKSQNIDVNIAGSYFKVIDKSSPGESKFCRDLLEMLDNPSNYSSMEPKNVVTPKIFPTFIRVPETGQASLVDPSYELPNLMELKLSYIRLNDSQNDENGPSWWKASAANCTNDCDTLKVVTFNDRIFTGFLALLSAPGIIGLYTTFVVFFARLIRTDPSGKVIYTEISQVDRVFALILDIYMMRESKEFGLEEKLFAKVLFLYRSPELLIEWSKRDDLHEQPQLAFQENQDQVQGRQGD